MFCAFVASCFAIVTSSLRVPTPPTKLGQHGDIMPPTEPDHNSSHLTEKFKMREPCDENGNIVMPKLSQAYLDHHMQDLDSRNYDHLRSAQLKIAELLLGESASEVTGNRMKMGTPEVDVTALFPVGLSTHTFHRRKYLTYVPQSVKTKQPTALFFYFHSYALPAEMFCAMSHTQMAADQFGFVAVCPQGVGGEHTGWNLGNAAKCCGDAGAANIDDMSYIRRLLRDLKPKVGAPEDKVFASGWSTGGGFTYRLLCEMSEEFYGGAPMMTAFTSTELGWGSPWDKQCTPTFKRPIVDVMASHDCLLDWDFAKSSWEYYSKNVLQCEGESKVVSTTQEVCRMDPGQAPKMCSVQCEVFECPLVTGGHHSVTCTYDEKHYMPFMAPRDTTSALTRGA